MFLWVWMLLGCLALASASSSQFVSVCNHAAEPTIADICSFVSPLPPQELAGLTGAVHKIGAQLDEAGGHDSHAGLLLSAFRQVTGGVLRGIAEAKVPIASLVSDGVFTLNTSFYQDLQVESEIKLLQKKPLLQRHICALVSYIPQFPFEIPVIGVFNPCQCWGSLSLADAGLSTAKLHDDGFEEEEDWCLYQDPCSDEDTSPPDICIIKVDPFRPACAVFLVQSEQPIDSSKSASHYKFDVPMIQKSQHLNRWLARVQGLPFIRELQNGYLQYIYHLISPIISSFPLPYYPIMLFIAVALLSVEEALADNVMVQYIVTVLLGVLLAAFALAIVIIRSINNIKNSIPFSSYVPAGVSTVLLSFIMFTTSLSFAEILADHMWKFWCDGAFGISWAGKIYFTFSAIAALFVKQWYKLFEDDSTSHWMLRCLLRGIGMWMLVFHSSPSIELAGIFAIISLWKDNIAAWEHSARVEFVGHLLHTPSINYSGCAPLSETEYERQGNEFTKKALADLRKHLQDNSNVLTSVTDSFRVNKKEDKAHLLDLFARNKYRGVGELSTFDSISDTDEDGTMNKNGGRRNGSLLKSILVVVLVCLLVGFVYRPVAEARGFVVDWQEPLVKLSSAVTSSVQDFFNIPLAQEL